MNTLELDLDALSETSRNSIIVWANRWNCTPSEAAARLLDAAAKKRKPRNPQPEKHAA
jgi:hypothetical protein